MIILCKVFDYGVKYYFLKILDGRFVGINFLGYTLDDVTIVVECIFNYVIRTF